MTDFDGDPKKEGGELSPREKIMAVAEEAFDAISETAANFADAEVKATAMSFERDFQRVSEMSDKFDFALEDEQKLALARWGAAGLSKIRETCDQNPDNEDVRNTALSFERLFREIGKLAE